MATTTVLTQDLYPAGTYYSNPLAWPSNLQNVTATCTLSAPDMANAAKQCTLVVEVSFDGGLSYSEAIRDPWTGNTLDHNGQPVPPQVSVGYQAGSTPTHSRIRLELPASLSIGATLLNS